MAKNKKEENGKFSANEAVFGVSSERADEIINAFKHARIDNDNWLGTIDQVRKTAKLKGEGENGYFGYIFGRMYEQDQNPMDGLLSHILRHRHSEEE